MFQVALVTSHLMTFEDPLKCTCLPIIVLIALLSAATTYTRVIIALAMDLKPSTKEYFASQTLI